jgi:adenine-specific DNA-methyltransferase
MTKIENIDIESKDIKSEQIEKLKKIFPEIVADGKIDFEQLKATLGEEIEDSKERFGLTWAGKSKCFKIIQDPSSGTLRPFRNKSINFDTTSNIFIEGDNLEVLKLLQKSYYEKIKVIFIDPPYNTGSDFVYPDNYGQQLEEYLKITGQVDSEGNKLTTNTDANGRYHSNWLNMIYPRLFLARNLLKEDGIIFINIDEHEHHNLQHILNEIFGEQNNLGTIIWDKKNPKGDAKGVAYQHESILVYAKDKDAFLLKNQFVRNKKNASNMLKKAKELFDKVGKGYLLTDVNKDFAKWVRENKELSGGESAYNKIDQEGNVYRGVSMAWPNKKKAPADYFIPLIHPVTNKECPVPERGWRNPPSTMNELITKNLILFGEDESKQPERKYLLKENMQENVPSVIPFAGSDDVLLKKLNIPFENPKPVSFIKSLLSCCLKDKEIVLDFFAGSGTTAHAVLDLNVEENTNRKFISIQLPELIDETSEAYKAGFRNIADLSIERIKKSIDLIKKESESEQNKLDLGFREFKLDRSNFKKWDNQTQELQTSLNEHVEQIKSNANPEDVLYEVLIKDGFELTTKINKVQVKGKDIYSIENNLLLICLDEKLDLDLFKEMKKLNPHLVIVLDKGFKDNDQLKTNAVQTLGKNSDEEYILRSI